MQITFEQTKKLVQNIIWQIQGDNIRFDVVVGLSRGGLIPGVMLSHYFDIPFVPLQYSTRDFAKSLTKQTFEPLLKYNNILIVDDINDTGLTLSNIKEQTTNDFNIHTAVLVENIHSKFESNYHGMELEVKEFIDFEWEKFWIM